MPLEFTTGFGVNSLIWITSLSPDEMGTTRRIVEDLQPFFKGKGLDFLYYPVPSAADLYEKLDGLAERARLGARPMLHLDMHGSKDGLAIAATREIATWKSLIPKFQAINVATDGNLCVVAGVCFALHAIREVKLSEPCPIHILIAPEDIVTVGFLEDATVKFYQEVFSSGQVEKAHEEHLSAQLKVFYSEKLLAVALAKYIRESCKGKGGAQRRERLLTEIMLSGQPRTPTNLKRIRKLLKEVSRPDQALVDKYARTFLAGRPCPFTIDDLLALVEGANKLKG
jgi:hypothetical protein